ncbi:hypothetical protein HAP94_10050 [Acidithiobacillus ferrivorans]|nr:hypothetical protein [Acidithiobacillus ferrivorans]
MKTSNIMRKQDIIENTQLCIEYGGSSTIFTSEECQELINDHIAEMVCNNIDEDEIETQCGELYNQFKNIVLVNGIWRWASYEGDVELDEDEVALVDRKIQELYTTYLASMLWLERSASEHLLFDESDEGSYTSI